MKFVIHFIVAPYVFVLSFWLAYRFTGLPRPTPLFTLLLLLGFYIGELAAEFTREFAR